MNIFYDGKTSTRHDVIIEQSEAGITLFEHGLDIAFFSAQNIRLVEEGKVLRLSFNTADETTPRLDIHDAALAKELMTRFSIKKQTVKSERKQTSKILLWSGLAIAASFGFLTLGMPYLSNTLAKLVPKSAEISIGNTFDSQVQSMFGEGKNLKHCTNEAGKAALDKLMGKLEAQSGMHLPLKVKMLDIGMVNAFATTGGHVYLLDGLLQRAESPDQFAGVIAHEIGHLYHRHVLQNVIEVGGVSLFLGQVFGDFTGSTALLYIAKQAISATHSRAFENQSDSYGVELMKKAGGDPRALATMLEKIDPSKSTDKSFTTWMRSHPITSDRVKSIRDASGEVGMKAPLLTGEEWLALKDICKKTIEDIPAKPPKGQGA